MTDQQIHDSIHALTEEYLHGDARIRSLVLRELAGYVRALLDTGDHDAATKVAGIVTTLMHGDQ